MKFKYKNILLVDTQPTVAQALKWMLKEHQCCLASSLPEVLSVIRRLDPAVMLFPCDLKNELSVALEWIKTVRELSTLIKIILIIEKNQSHLVIQAIQQGAYDFCEQPLDEVALQYMLERAYSLNALEKDYNELIQVNTYTIHGMITADKKMEHICRMIEKVANVSASILLIGESGTGKEVVAHAIHELSDRKKGKFIAINCSAIPETLLESELFGYEKGAFTGAHQQHFGKIERANGGTLFLDEIGDLPLSLQPKLLRFLQDRKIERVGGTALIPVDVRVICATNRNLKQLISEKIFREDLYYRINEMEMILPPLRERGQDVLLIAQALLKRFCRELQQPQKQFSPDALELLEAYDWPGNVRELENRIKSVVILSENKVIHAKDLKLSSGKPTMPFNLRVVREEAERKAIHRALTYTNYNVSQSAALLGVTRPTLYNLLDKLNLRQEDVILCD
jgi:two-component system NtrC family response regulator